MEALTGQVFLATLVARLVAAFRASAEQARPITSRPRPPRPVRRGPKTRTGGNQEGTSRRRRSSGKDRRVGVEPFSAGDARIAGRAAHCKRDGTRRPRQ